MNYNGMVSAQSPDGTRHPCAFERLGCDSSKSQEGALAASEPPIAASRSAGGSCVERVAVNMIRTGHAKHHIIIDRLYPTPRHIL